MTIREKIDWCFEQHRKTNHFYDKYLPYEFHLRMVMQVAADFEAIHDGSDMLIACAGHDLIEDARKSYNDCKEVLGEYVAEIIYAVSNEKGRSRKERANDKYYKGITSTPGAIFVKLCDRIANVQYSKLTQSSMYDMYKSENESFIKVMYSPMYEPMTEYLIKLFAH